MSKLETFEWESLWWEHPENKTHRHILYIGDSISRGTTPKLNALANGILVDNFATSKAVDNPYFNKSLSVFAAQDPGYDTVLFNNGLHGFHLSVEEYEKCYEELFKALTEMFKNAKFYILLSTFTKKDYDDITLNRNEAVMRIAEKYGVELIDLYSVAKENENTICSDDVHFTDQGYELLAKEILTKI